MAARAVAFPVAALSLGQIVGWGSTYYLLAVCADTMMRELVLPAELVFSGMAIMLLTSALVAIPAGRLIEQCGPARCLPVGAIVLGAGLAALAAATDAPTFALAWMVMGLGAPFALTQAATTAIVSASPGSARSSLAVYLMLTAATPTVAIPMLEWARALGGWRMTCVALAAAQVLLVAPLNAMALRERSMRVARPRGAPQRLPGAPGKAVWALAVAFGLFGLVAWAIGLHIITLATALGHERSVALLGAALIGPAHLAARIADLVLARRVALGKAGLGYLLLVLLSLLVLLALGDSTAGFVASMSLFALGAGGLTIVRAALPAALFGNGFAREFSRISAALNLAGAAAPIAAVTALSSFGARGFAVSAVVLVALALAAYVTGLRSASARAGSIR